MKRRGFLAILLILVFGSLVLLGGVGEAKVIKLRYANFPPAPTFPCVQMERWAREVEKRTGGKVKVETYPGGTLLGAKNMFDGVIAGTADIGCFCPSYHPGRFPLLEAVDQPIGYPNTKVASLTLFDLYRKWQPKSLKKVKVVTMFTCAPTHLMMKVPLRRLGDFKGVEIRAAGTLAKSLGLLGATPVAMPMSDVPEALQKGVIKGLLSSLEVMKDFKFAEYCRYVTYLGFQVVSFAVVMNKDTWNSLPKDVQKVIDDLSREQALWTGRYMDDHVKEAIEWSKKTYNVEFIKLPPEDMVKAKKLVKPMIDAYIKRAKAAGVPADKVMKDVYSLRDKLAAKYGD
ncbi:MAG: C4-dicarboxylate ABC transporter substrate-binding protein [Deltaproteobacteria bacterium]|nr:MAG: C4-dicarboxylate ABC transporter substrate-binding protein [Deltaproteobacteria bacterium]